jgi:hypothetical protein
MVSPFKEICMPLIALKREKQYINGNDGQEDYTPSSSCHME